MGVWSVKDGCVQQHAFDVVHVACRKNKVTKNEGPDIVRSANYVISRELFLGCGIGIGMVWSISGVEQDAFSVQSGLLAQPDVMFLNMKGRFGGLDSVFYGRMLP